MNEYDKKAHVFLCDCGAKIKMMYLGREKNENWDDKQERDAYMVSIATPRGNMQFKFWDSIYNTRKNMFAHKEHRAWSTPTAYDILSCLTTYDDFTRIQNTYNAVKKEYEDVCRCFTEEQIERLCEIR